MSAPPPTPSRPLPPPDPTGGLATFLALGGLLFLGLALLALMAMVNVAVLGIFVVVSGFAVLTAGHYVIWGRWLSRLPPPDDDD